MDEFGRETRYHCKRPEEVSCGILQTPSLLAVVHTRLRIRLSHAHMQREGCADHHDESCEDASHTAGVNGRCHCGQGMARKNESIIDPIPERTGVAYVRHRCSNMITACMGPSKVGWQKLARRRVDAADLLYCLDYSAIANRSPNER